MTPADQILAGKTRLMFNNPFFGTMLAHLQPEESTATKTIDTDGNVLRFNPEHIAALSLPAIEFTLAGIVLHIARHHHVRCGGRDLAKWNRACDYAINGELITTKVGVAPPGTLHDPAYDGMGAEEIYRLLPDDPSDGGGGQNGNDPGGTGGITPAAAPSDQAALKEAAAEADIRTRQAAAIAKAANAGTLSADAARLLAELTAPRVDWRAELRQFASECENTVPSWSRPNKRMLSLGFTLPSRVSDGLAHLVCVADTSGSIQGDMLAAFAAEIDDAFATTAIDRLTVIYADAKVKGVDTFERGDTVELRPVGGGGTNFRPSFDWISENAHDATAIIYLTDLVVNDFGDDPGTPVLWAVYGDSRKFGERSARAPFGTAVHVSPE